MVREPGSDVVVVIDDDHGVVDLLLELLKRERFTAYGAYSGEEGLALVQRHEPGVVLTDLRMESMDGLEVLRETKAIDPVIEVIIITAFPDLTLALSAMKGGACDYLLKPLPNVDALGHAVRRAFERRHLNLENQRLLERIQHHERELLERVEEVTAELHRDNEVLRLVSDLSRSLNKDLELDSFVQATERFFASLSVPWTMFLFRIDREEGQYSLLCTTHAATRATMPRTLPIGAVPAFDRIEASGKPNLVRPDALDEADCRALRRALVEPPSLVLPLVAGSGPLGIMVLNIGGEGDAREKDLQLAMLCGETLSLALSNCLLFQKTREQARCDGLSGLYNHAHFREILSQEMRRAQRYGQELALVMLDIDDFKQVNDRHGHVIGDEVIRRLATVLKTETRAQIDVACRYGGEEFAVLLPSTGSEGAVRQGERLRQAIERAFETNPVPGVAEPITVSVGVASGEEADSPMALIEHADAALYEAKRSGKNCCRAYRSSDVAGV